MISKKKRSKIISSLRSGATVKEVQVEHCIGKTLAYELKKLSNLPGVSDILLGNDGLTHDNTRILFISDDHEPYSHPDKFEFLRAIKDEYAPTRVAHVGDEVDQHYLNFHIKEHTILNPVGEKGKAISGLRKLQDLFPKMDLLSSNHGDLAYRKAKVVGLLPDDLKSRKDRFLIDADWTWHDKLTLNTELGKVHIEHAVSSNVLTASKGLGMSFIQGHYHTRYALNYWSTPDSLNFALQMPCLIDVHCDAFNYINPFRGRVMIGAAILLNGIPKLIPLVKKKSGRWNGRIN